MTSSSLLAYGLLVIGGFFALNMGAPSFAGSFSTAAGARLLSRRKAAGLFLLFALPLFAGEAASNEENLQADLAQGKMVPYVVNGETQGYRMDPTTHELENKKITKVEKDTTEDDEE